MLGMFQCNNSIKYNSINLDGITMAESQIEFQDPSQEMMGSLYKFGFSHKELHGQFCHRDLVASCFYLCILTLNTKSQSQDRKEANARINIYQWKHFESLSHY